MSQPLSVFLTEVTSAPSKSPLNFISDFDSSLSSPLRAKSCAVALNLSESPSVLIVIVSPSDVTAVAFRFSNAPDKVISSAFIFSTVFAFVSFNSKVGFS